MILRRFVVTPGDIILVCDVGGGTADFSLIAVTDVAGNLELERISVGEHILLGGDNMDLALAYTLQARLPSPIGLPPKGLLESAVNLHPA